MTYLKPGFHHPDLPKNQLGYAYKDYEGGLSTLCAGCGHDSISAAIVQSCFELNIQPHSVAKMSGIGCSSKTPTYFLNNSHGFNSVHGRMPSVATGANMANKDLIYIGISGDGDSASIGMGQFVHVIRRNLNMVYIVMNNGCYGLTKGQDSATADVGSKSKAGSVNMFQGIQLPELAIQLGASFVGRSFSGDKEQLIPMIKAAIRHPGFALLDVISPCVTFNNNAGSTKSYDYVRDHIEMIGAIDFVPPRATIETSYPEGTTIDIEQFDGSILRLQKPKDFNPTDKKSVMEALMQAESENEILTGLLYINQNSKDLHQILNTSDIPLNKLTQAELCPGPKALEQINASYR